MLTLKPSISETNGFSFAHFWKPLWMNSLGEKIGGVISKADTASRYSMEMLIEIPTEAGAGFVARGANGMATTAAGQVSTAHSSNAHLPRLILLTQGGDIILTRGWESHGLMDTEQTTLRRPRDRLNGVLPVHSKNSFLPLTTAAAATDLIICGTNMSASITSLLPHCTAHEGEREGGNAAVHKQGGG